MEVNGAISESLVRLIAFHNAFNRNVKLSFGALSALVDESVAKSERGVITLPTGDEPWGKQTLWRELDQPVKDAALFLAEIGVVRATAAFEDYLDGAKAEFDRAGLTPTRQKADGCSAMKGLDAIFGIEPDIVADCARMTNFFNVARNCVVHRSNQASNELAMLRNDPGLAETLARWPKRVGRWKVDLPLVDVGSPVNWRPRHAILASDVYYRSAKLLDRRLVESMGALGLAGMAAHWCFFADPPAPCQAKLDGGVMVRSQLIGRYKLRAITLADTIDNLREIGRWDEIRKAFESAYPDGPQSSLARRRRARKQHR